MKKLAMVLLGIMVMQGIGSAATVSSAAVPVSVIVDGSLSMNLTLRKNSSTGAVISGMNFGELKEVVPGTLRTSTTSSTGTGNVTAVISANSHSLPYIITQSGTVLTNGSSTIPAGACTVVPVYATQDNGGASLPSGASLGSAGSWVGNKTLYSSESSNAAIRVFQAIYSVTDDPAAGATGAVPVNQATGTYTGTVTFTVTT